MNAKVYPSTQNVLKGGMDTLLTGLILPKLSFFQWKSQIRRRLCVHSHADTNRSRLLKIYRWVQIRLPSGSGAHKTTSFSDHVQNIEDHCCRSSTTPNSSQKPISTVYPIRGLGQAHMDKLVCIHYTPSAFHPLTHASSCFLSFECCVIFASIWCVFLLFFFCYFSTLPCCFLLGVRTSSGGNGAKVRRIPHEDVATQSLQQVS